MNMILTNIGEELASNGFLTGVFPKITKIMFGDGNGAMVTPLKTMTALVHPIQEGIGTTVTKMSNPNRLALYTQIPQSVGGITIREVGLFNDANQLIAIGGNFEKIKPLISESVEKFDFYITIPLSSAQDITVAFSNDNIYADQNAVDLLNIGVEARRLENINMDTRVVDIETNRISVPTAYNIYNGKVTLDNTIVNVGVGTYAYTGNTTVLPSFSLGMDIESQWGNDVSEKYGYLIQIRTKDTIGEWYWVDSVRGITKYISSSTTAIEGTDAAMFTLSTVGGVTTINIGTSAKTNTNGVAYILYVYQTTHRKTCTTNHNVTEAEHYNPTTGLTILGYAGSSKIEHQLNHSLGRKLAYLTFKNLTAATGMVVYTPELDSNKYLYLSSPNGSGTPSNTNCTANTITISHIVNVTNDATNNYIMYGFRNSYFDDDNVLVGIFEIGTYLGGYTNNHNIVPTRARPGILDLKRFNNTGNWYRWDVIRPSNKALPLNSNVASPTYAFGNVNYNSFKLTQSDPETNAIGESYLYFIVYDNDNLSGKTKYKKSTDTSNITLNALVPYADGIDTHGNKISITYKNETITGLTLTSGRNRIYSKKDGTYGVSKYDPMMYAIRERLYADENPDYFDLKTHKWYSVIPAVDLIANGKFDLNTNGWNGYTGATLAAVNGVMTITGGTTGVQGYTTINVVAGVKYRFRYAMQLGTSQGAGIVLGTAIGDSSILYFMTKEGLADNLTGKYDFDFTASYTGIVYVSLLNNGTTGSTWSVDDITIFDSIPILNVLITSRNYLNCIVYADQNGQPTYIEEIDKETYFNKVVADIVTAGGIDLTFLNQLTGNGYQKLPGGLILQWGAITIGDIADANYKPVSFPIAFTTRCLSIASSSGELAAGKWDLFIAPNPSTTQFLYATSEYQAVVQTASFNYIALGF